MFRLRLAAGGIASVIAVATVGSAGSAFAGGSGHCIDSTCFGESSDLGQPPPPPPPTYAIGQGTAFGTTYNAPQGSRAGVRSPGAAPSTPRPLTPAQQFVAAFAGCGGQTGLAICPGGRVGTPYQKDKNNSWFDPLAFVPFLRNIAPPVPGAPAAPARPARPGAPAAPAMPPPPSPAQVAAMARAQLTVPKPTIGSAPCTAADCKGAVGVPVWLWTDPGMFTPTSQTATVGPVSVTVTAVATGVTWDMGDGQTVTCDGPGTKYDTAVYGWADSPDCGYKYTQTSTDQPSGRYPLTATATWAITFSGDFAGTDQVTTTSTTNVAIGEYQAIVKAG